MSKTRPEYPSYVPLRVGADWSSAIRGQMVYFRYADGELRITDNDTGSVPVATAPSAKRRPAVTGVILHVEREDGDIHMEIDPQTCSALFWTESAVEKFLLPYYTSAAGPEAYAVMYAIIRAWYHYDERRPVVALAFSYAPVDSLGRKSLWNTVDVIYVEDGQVKQSPRSSTFSPTRRTWSSRSSPGPFPWTMSAFRWGGRSRATRSSTGWVRATWRST